MILLTVDEIIDVHKEIVHVTGGSPELRDRGFICTKNDWRFKCPNL